MDYGMLVVYLTRLLAMGLVLPVHEAAHALAADRLGDPTARQQGRLTLSPRAHLDVWGSICMLIAGIGWARPVPVDPRYFKNPKWGMAFSAAAGPLSNLVMAWLSAVGMQICAGLAQGGARLPLVIALLFFQTLFYLNLNLAIFNLLPIPPFDGSRILLVVLPQKWYFRVMRRERLLLLVIFLLLILGVFDPVLVWLDTHLTRFFLWSTGFVGLFFGSFAN